MGHEGPGNVRLSPLEQASGRPEGPAKLPARGKKTVAVKQQWSSDVTYIKLGKKYVFLAVVLDLFSRRIISWRLGESLSEYFARATLREAFLSRHPAPDLLFHTDRGVEYRAHKTRALLNHHRVRTALTARDNAPTMPKWSRSSKR